MVALGLIYFLVINTIEFVAFAVDKRRARSGAWRIPERRLLQLALAGGVVGAFTAQTVLRHKTRKQPFRTQLLVIGGTEAVVVFIVLLARAAQRL